MANTKIVMYNRFIRLIFLGTVFFLTGCAEEPSNTASRSSALASRTAKLIREKKVARMQEIKAVRLRELKKDMEMLKKRNPFSPPDVEEEEEAATSLVLEGIIWDEETPSAMINDMIVNEGDIIEDKKVKKITKDSVILIENGEEEVLKLKKFY